jgi:hypothetical protein
MVTTRNLESHMLTINTCSGQRGVAFVAPMCKVIAYVVTCVHPPYPVLPIIFMLAGFGNGLEGVYYIFISFLRYSLCPRILL